MTDLLTPVDEIRERHEYHDAGLDEGTQFSHKIALEVHKDRADLLRHIDALRLHMSVKVNDGQEVCFVCRGSNKNCPTTPTEDA